MNNQAVSPKLLENRSWTESEMNNVKMVSEFVQLIMNDHNFTAVLRKFNNDKYTQFNRNIPDGFENLVKYLTDFTKKFPEYSYDVKRITADGEYVTFHSHVTIKHAHKGNDKKGFSIIDTWKIEDGVIAAHWDAVQPLDFFMRMYMWLTGGNIKNNNGVF